MRPFLKWTIVLVVVIAVGAFGAFLYFIPPFFITPPETFGKAMADGAPRVDGISDPRERAIAARGRYLVMTTGCTGCPRDQRLAGSGPDQIPRRRRAEDPDTRGHVRQPQPDARSGHRHRPPHR